MNPSPPCRWREREAAGRFLCHSPKYVAPPSPVDLGFCATCTYVELPEEREPPSDNWHLLPNAEEAFRGRIAREVAATPEAPPFSQPRGMVICAGGWKFFPSLYVTVRMVRRTGCTWPIQVWYLGDRGEYDPRMGACLADWGVEWIDGNQAWRTRPEMQITGRNIDHGWMLKPYAAAFSPFAEVVSLDADSYPVRPMDPLLEHAEYLRTGAIFWPDWNVLEDAQWLRFGCRPGQRSGIESGQFVIDKRRNWRGLWLACFLNSHHEYTWKHVYGDKDLWGIAFRRVELDYAMPAEKPGWATHSYLQVDFAGAVQFVHRTAGKWRLEGPLDGVPVPTEYNTRQVPASELFVRACPGEDAAFGFLKALDELLRPQRHFRIARNVGVEHVWDHITLHNEYRFAGSYEAGDVAIDVGANMGAAAQAMLRRGMDQVFCLEPWPENAVLLEENMRRWGHRAVVLRRAAWRSDVLGQTVTLWPRADDLAHTGNINAFKPCGAGVEAATISLDEVIETATQGGSRRIRLLKIDCEGSEYPILFTCTRLDELDEIIGEWHLVDPIPARAQVEERPRFDAPALYSFLESRGFRIVDQQPFAHDHGLFWARRPQAALVQATRGAATIADLQIFEHRIHSQNGEDGILAAIFRAIGTTNRHFVELGAGPNAQECNCRQLWNEGWTGVFVGPQSASDLVKQYHVTAENIVAILRDLRTPKELDLLSIDIDGNDLWVWQAIHRHYQPRVLVIEYNAAVPPSESRTIAYDPEFTWNFDSYHGASLAALCKVSSGYDLIGCDSMGVNAFFVRHDAAGPFALRSLEQLFVSAKYLGWHGQPGHPASTRLMVEF